MSDHHLFFLAVPACSPEAVSLPPPGYSLEVWAPCGLTLRPRGCPMIPFAIWTMLFHHGRLFSNRSYRIVIIRKNSMVVHRTCIFPGYFRFPFMGQQDLQIGDTWTSPGERGKGLALFGLSVAINLAEPAVRRIWYLCNEDNAASISVARRAGMKLVGRGMRVPRFGIRILGSYILNKVNENE